MLNNWQNTDGPTGGPVDSVDDKNSFVVSTPVNVSVQYEGPEIGVRIGCYSSIVTTRTNSTQERQLYTG